jgi:pyridoxal phosphate enzyme (YggS family)
VAQALTPLPEIYACGSRPNPSEAGVPSIAENLAVIRERIARAAERSGRKLGDVKLIAVSKGHDAKVIREAFDAGQRAFGENYVQELTEKARALADIVAGLELHVIGSLQRNKVKDVVGLARAIHTVDRKELALEIEKRATRPIDVLIEVNVGREPQKSGCSPEDATALAEAIASLPKLRLVGFMAIPPLEAEASENRPLFAALRALRDRNLAAFPRAIELSMGMSHDFEEAILEGATIVRVGTAIFGARPPRRTG